MPHARPRKRPCSICRHWFIPDVHQKGRQTTCSSECRKERHRRQCERWNRKNKAYFRDIYLSQKLEKTAEPPEAKPPPSPKLPVVEKKSITFSSGRLNLDLPWDVIGSEFGKRRSIVLGYSMQQLVHHLRAES